MKETFLRCLSNSPWSFHEEGEDIKIAFVSEHAAWEGRVWLEEALGYGVVYGHCPVIASESRRQRVGEMCMRINYGLPAGSFELNFDTGECRVRTGLQLGPTDIDEEMLEAQVAAALETNFVLMAQYLAAILQAIYTDRPLNEILEAIEASIESEDEIEEK